jgi:hypothetical protein
MKTDSRKNVNWVPEDYGEDYDSLATQMRRMRGDADLPAPLRPLAGELTRIRFGELSDYEQDRLARLCAAVLNSLRLGRLRKHGDRITRWDTGGPVLKSPSSTDPGKEYALPDWAGHGYVVEAEDGVKSYISEALYIDVKLMRALVALAGEGWDVTLTAMEAVHVAGSTTAIVVRRAQPRPGIADGEGASLSGALHEIERSPQKKSGASITARAAPIEKEVSLKKGKTNRPTL